VVVIVNQCGLFIDVPGGNPSDGVPLQGWSEPGREVYQHWRIIPTRHAANVAYLISEHGKAIDIHGPSKELNAMVHTWEPHWQNSQMWKFEQNENGWYTISSVFSGYILDAQHPGSNPGDRLVLWHLTRASNQLWAIYKKVDNQWMKM
jgi:hypothetical protein